MIGHKRKRDREEHHQISNTLLYYVTSNANSSTSSGSSWPVQRTSTINRDFNLTESMRIALMSLYIMVIVDDHYYTHCLLSRVHAAHILRAASEEGSERTNVNYWLSNIGYSYRDHLGKCARGRHTTIISATTASSTLACGGRASVAAALARPVVSWSIQF